VLHTSGTQSEAGLAFAGLHQLLRPELTQLDLLPEPQRDALSAAFGMTDARALDPSWWHSRHSTCWPAQLSACHCC
jgi:hypothetical protein